MKIYFSGAIRGGRQNQSRYFLLIEQLRRHGSVLTEFVADPALTDDGNARIETETYRIDTELLRQCDVVVAEVTTPSLGVGYEICFAEKMGKPVLCLFRNDGSKKLSAMIRGNPNIDVFDYSILDEAESIIEQWINRQFLQKDKNSVVAANS